MQNHKEVIKTHLHHLCVNIENRHPGSRGNHAATKYICEQLDLLGWDADITRLECIDWQPETAALHIDGKAYPLKPAPYSLPFDGEAELVVVDNFEALNDLDICGKILLCKGKLTESQLIPQGYPFYNLDEHKEIFRILNARKPLAIIAATKSDPGGAGGISPFPWIEDARFDIPSCYCDAATGEKLALLECREVKLTIDSLRKKSWMEQISGLKGDRTKKRIVISAHVDTKIETPGALDNATGVAILLVLAEMLQSYDGDHYIELVFFNGEDYYDSTGECHYMEINGDKLSDFALVANIDAAGCKEHRSGLSHWNLSEQAASLVDGLIEEYHGIEPMDPWPASDHMIFVPRGVPTLVFTSANIWDLAEHITHTMRDNINLVDPARLVEIAEFLYRVVNNPLGLEKA